MHTYTFVYGHHQPPHTFHFSLNNPTFELLGQALTFMLTWKLGPLYLLLKCLSSGFCSIPSCYFLLKLPMGGSNCWLKWLDPTHPHARVSSKGWVFAQPSPSPGRWRNDRKWGGSANAFLFFLPFSQINNKTTPHAASMVWANLGDEEQAPRAACAALCGRLWDVYKLSLSAQRQLKNSSQLAAFSFWW